jgi:hypothetical protein
MQKRGLHGNWPARLVILASLVALAACSGRTVESPPSQSGDLAELEQQVAAQATRVAALEAQAAPAQLEAAQETRIAVLETQVARTSAAAIPVRTATLVPTLAPKTPTLVPTLPPRTPSPSPTPIPPVTGLATDGATKGAADAPVTITEYVDYL